MQNQPLSVELSAMIVTLAEGEPVVLTTKERRLPSGPFGLSHRTLEQALRAWVKSLGDTDLGYVEQLYTFADQGREAAGARKISIGYLALIRDGGAAPGLTPSPWYALFPWEDRRTELNPSIKTPLQKGLSQWKNEASTAAAKRARGARIAVTFPDEPREWNDELVLQRYELLWEAGLLPESEKPRALQIPGLSMAADHRRIIATGMARLRAKIKYRPVVFELLPDRFTLLALQNTVEALAGLRQHKQNFRRLVLNEGLVEETAGKTQAQAGRPARLFAFRHEILRERAVAGTKLARR